MSLQIEVVQGPMAGKRWRLTKPGPHTLGRMDTELALVDPSVSRRHASVSRQGGHWCLQDLGSSNGVLINGVKLDNAHTIRTGDRAFLGDSEVLFTVERFRAQSTITVAALIAGLCVIGVLGWATWSSHQRLNALQSPAGPLAAIQQKLSGMSASPDRRIAQLLSDVSSQLNDLTAVQSQLVEQWPALVQRVNQIASTTQSLSQELDRQRQEWQALSDALPNDELKAILLPRIEALEAALVRFREEVESLRTPPTHEPGATEAPASTRSTEPVDGVVFVIDASGSMIDTLPQVGEHLHHRVTALDDDEPFGVIFCHAGVTIDALPGPLQPRSPHRLQTLATMLDPELGVMRPHGRGDVIGAVVAAADHHPREIVLLTDAATGLDLDALTQRVAAIETQRGQPLRLSVIQFARRDAAVSLDQLARAQGGTYVLITPNATHPSPAPTEWLIGGP